jgi:hypothetical protein
VFEFGALFGYFLVTALDACPSDRVRVGWVDNETAHPGSNILCEENVESVRSGIALGYGNSRDLLPVRVCDVVSVDGDHSYEGCFADLLAADRLEPRLILVDDWDADTHRVEIRAATHRFLDRTQTMLTDLDGNRRPHAYELTDEIATQNGLAVLRRKDTL